MRTIIVLSFLSLDGVMQGPGGPEEDTSGGFLGGGWTVPFFDEELGAVMGGQMAHPFDLLLGRKTFETFASYWPNHPEEGAEINRATKYVVSRTMTSHEWQRSVFIGGDVATAIDKLKREPGNDLHVHGSSELVQTLLAKDLVDEIWMKVFPVTLGYGKRLFGSGTIPGQFELRESSVTPAGVIVANYRRSGDLKTGSF